MPPKILYFLKIALINLFLFFLIYIPTNRHFVFLGATNEFSLFFPWEKGIPFVSWMIVPYLLFNVLFLLPLFLLPRQKMKELGMATALCTICAGFLFFIFPAQLGFERVLPNDSTRFIYEKLFRIDTPTNLVPSLHVAYSTLFFLSCVNFFRSKIAKILWSILIFIIIASTLFTHQHHVLDIVSGILLGELSYWVFSNKLFPDVRKHL